MSVNVLYGRSLNLAELMRQCRIRRFSRARFFGLVIGRWHIGVTCYQRDTPEPT